MFVSSFTQAASLDEGPVKVAALATWIQSLNAAPGSRPILVGGGAVELYSGGAYRTGDLDFVGTLGKEATQQLEAVGFRKSGRHWIHEEYQIFLEFPSASLSEGETVATINVGEYEVLIIGLEELIIDRLAAWTFWNSGIDGVNAFRLVRINPQRVDLKRLRELAKATEVTAALDALVQFAQQADSAEPDLEALESWARDGVGRTR